MELEDYIEKWKSIQSNLLEFIEFRENFEEYYDHLIQLFEDQKIRENKHELKSLVFLLLKISNNHFRDLNFFARIEKIFLLFKDEIKQTFSNSELFTTFKNSKRLLLFLVRENILELNDTFCENMTSKKCRSFYYLQYLYPDVKPFISKPMMRKIEKDLPENYLEKREIGENDDYICEIIRKDLVDKFDAEVTSKKISLESTVKDSIFETNAFLLENDPTLLEYAAFYGSINIINYFIHKNIELTPSIWLYSIHGRNSDLIQMLVDKKISPEDKSYERCLEEAVKCHHNEIANYIHDNLISQESNHFYIETNYNRNLYSYAYHYYNFHFFTNNFDHRFTFFYLCQYDYFTLVVLYLEKKKFYPQMTVILTFSLM